jgi:hypothetical protein
MTKLTRLRHICAAAALAGMAAASSVANAACPEPVCDEQQIGPYVAPDIAPPDLAGKFDPRGKPIPIPLPGLDGFVVRHRPGAGVWVSEAPGKANVFVKPGRERVTVDVKVDF